MFTLTDGFSAQHGLVREEMGTSRHCCLATSSSRGLTGNAVTGLAVWSLQMDGGGEGGQLLEMMFWLGGTWAGNATTKKKKSF